MFLCDDVVKNLKPNLCLVPFVVKHKSSAFAPNESLCQNADAVNQITSPELICASVAD